MLEIVAYIVKRPEAPIDFQLLRRDPVDAWRLYLNVDEPDATVVERLARHACQMDGVRLCCLRLVPSGYRAGL